MKIIYYYSFKELGLRWSECKQTFKSFETWDKFIDFIKNLSAKHDVEIRACKSRGYNNQGYYIREYKTNQ